MEEDHRPMILFFHLVPFAMESWAECTARG